MKVWARKGEATLKPWGEVEDHLKQELPGKTVENSILAVVDLLANRHKFLPALCYYPVTVYSLIMQVIRNWSIKGVWRKRKLSRMGCEC